MKIARNKSRKKKGHLHVDAFNNADLFGDRPSLFEEPEWRRVRAAGKRKKRTKHGRVDVSCRIFPRRARVIIKLKPRALYMYKTEAAHFSDRCTFESSL